MRVVDPWTRPRSHQLSLSYYVCQSVSHSVQLRLARRARLALLALHTNTPATCTPPPPPNAAVCQPFARTIRGTTAPPATAVGTQAGGGGGGGGGRSGAGGAAVGGDGADLPPRTVFFLAWPSSTLRQRWPKSSAFEDSEKFAEEGEMFRNIRHFESPDCVHGAADRAKRAKRAQGGRAVEGQAGRQAGSGREGGGASRGSWAGRWQLGGAVSVGRGGVSWVSAPASPRGGA
eukprot:COSAG01_NODE_1003_length_12216_cov_8.565350_8_plen_232_part_00